MKKIWDKVVHEGYLIALGDISAMYALSLMIGLSITWDYLLVVFLMIFSLLSFNYYKEIDKDMITNPKRAKLTSRRKKILPLIIIFSSVLALVLVYIYSSILTVIFLVCLIIGGSLYTVRLKSLTVNVIGFKSFYVASFYSMLVILMALYYKISLTSAVFLVLVFYFTRIFINTVFCDVRDIDGDNKNKIKTFAIVLGEKKSIFYLNCINILSTAPIVLGVVLNIIPTYSLFILITIIYTAFNLFAYKEDIVKRMVLFNVLIEGEFIIWMPVLMIGKYVSELVT